MNMHPRQDCRGIALVVVLVFLVLLSVFIVGFFSNSQDELTAATSFSAEASASHLAESAVSVVMGQVREATSRTNGAWGSQPGMIRVYRDGDNVSPKADAFFKLYSSDDMIVSGKEIQKYDPMTEIPEGAGTGWNHLPSLWTDLNEPVVATLPNSTTNVTHYPILDPRLDRKVEGLEISQSSKDDSGYKTRMPVRWIYVLRDGTLTVPTKADNNGLEAKWDKGNRAPSKSNPIVGRIAFWTDDETSKVNINTAGGYSLKPEKTKGDGGMPTRDAVNRPFSEDDYAGSFWDTPRVVTAFDVGLISKTGNYKTFNNTVQNNGSDGEMDRGGLALSQPVRGEFQRYPGHPATTSLGILFRDRPANPKDSMQFAPYALTSGQLALLAPRLQYSFDVGDQVEKEKRASNYGTSRLLVTKKVDPNDDPYVASDDPPDLRVKRLYASVDELFYAQPEPDQAKAQRLQNQVELRETAKNDGNGVLTPELLEQMRFFLTASSRSPELNLFGRPRVTLWPVHSVNSVADENTWWNASDRLLAFCSLIGADGSKLPEQKVTRFIFQRSDSTSPIADAQLGRNDSLYTYLRELTDQPFPGFGKSFSSKYGRPDRDSILTEMIDYMRVVNLRDSIHDKVIDQSPSSKPGTAANVQQKERWKFAPRGLVVPLKFTKTDTVGFGRFPGISEAALVIYHAGYQVGGNPNGSGGQRYLLKSEIPPDKNKKAVKPTYDLIRAFMIFETFNPMQGFAPITRPNTLSVDANKKCIIFEVTGLENFAVDGKNLGFPTKAINRYNHSPVDFWHGRNTGGPEGFFHTLYKPDDRPYSTNFPALPVEDPADSRFYQLQSTAGLGDLGTDRLHPGIAIPYLDRTQLDTPPYKISLTGTTLTVKTYFGSVSPANLVRTNTLKFENVPAILPPRGDEGDAVFNVLPDPESLWVNGSRVPATTPPFYSVQTSGNDPGGFIPTAGQGHWWGFKGAPVSWTAPYTSVTSFVKSFAGRMWWIRNADSNNYADNSGKPTVFYGNRWRQILQPGDVVRSVVYGKGDFRIGCLNSNADDIYTLHPDYKSDVRHAHTLRAANGTLYHWDTKFGSVCKLPGMSYPNNVAADLPESVDGVRRGRTVDETLTGPPGDFDTGLGNLSDGPYCNKPDEGNLVFQHRNDYYDDQDQKWKFKFWDYPSPYFTWTYQDGFETFFTPNRQIPSAVLFGSLPAGKSAHWTTLCFSPNPAGDSHPGRNDPKDYLWLDLFTMPVVEPYAISEPFSTAGKINMNYQIVPFSHIKRSTGMRAALQPVRVTAISPVEVNSSKQVMFKSGDPYLPPKFTPGTGANINFRYLVDRDETLKAFDDPKDGYFAQYQTDRDKGFFKSAAEICDFYLYPRRSSTLTTPQVPTNVRWVKGDTAIKGWWKGNMMTGDNVREKPYADLYPRLTTKSNTFCVHVRAQALRQSAAPDAESAAEHYRTWSEKHDRVVGEYRGASIIERYIDPQDERFSTTGDRANKINVDKESVEAAYRFRVLNTKRFDP